MLIYFVIFLMSQFHNANPNKFVILYNILHFQERMSSKRFSIISQKLFYFKYFFAFLFIKEANTAEQEKKKIGRSLIQEHKLVTLSLSWHIVSH